MSGWKYLAIYAGAFFFIFVGVWVANDIFIGVPIHSAVMALIVATLFMAFIGYQHLNKKNYRPDREHGSAVWGNKRNARNYIDPKPENNIILTQTDVVICRGQIHRCQIKQRNHGVCGYLGRGVSDGENSLFAL